MEDRQIVALLWKRTESALEALARKFGKGLYRLSMNILGNPPDAEENVNDTYLAIWNAIPPANPDPLTGYVYRVGRNTALKRLRNSTAQKRDSRYDLSLDELSAVLPGASLEEALDARLLGLSIDRFLDGQSRQNRVLFLRRYWFGDTVSQIAAAYAMTPGSVSVRLNRLRQALKEHLRKEDFFL